jgi:uncharacterized membrane protein
MAAIAFEILVRAIITKHGRESLLALAVGKDWKGKVSPALYLVAIPLAFVSSAVASAIYVCVALLWLVPDRRIEKALKKSEH